MQKVGHRDRAHPLCRHCRYDLVATIAANKRVCPECGEPFTLSETVRAPRPGEWTVGVGIRRALVAIVMRSALVLPFWAGFVWLLAPIVNAFPFSIFAMGGVAVLFIVPGVAIGHVVSRRLNDIAGAQSYLFTIMAVVCEIAVAMGGVEIAQIWRPLPQWADFIAMTATAYAALWTWRNTHFAE
jgi:hypothetical protein